jgi:hypothetical protein
MRFASITAMVFIAFAILLIFVGARDTGIAFLILGNIWAAADYVTEYVRLYLFGDSEPEHVWTAPNQRADQDYSARAAFLSPTERARRAAAKARAGKNS